MLEQRGYASEIALYFGDEISVSEEGYVPYGWQFRDENIIIAAAKGKCINCFRMITRDNRLVYSTTYETINADFIIEHLDALSLHITKHIVVVLDNARVHQIGRRQIMQQIWAKRNLFIFNLPLTRLITISSKGYGKN